MKRWTLYRGKMHEKADGKYILYMDHVEAIMRDRPAALEKAARQVIEESPEYVGKEMLLALAELDTALAESQEGKEKRRNVDIDRREK